MALFIPVFCSVVLSSLKRLETVGSQLSSVCILGSFLDFVKLFTFNKMAL